MKNLFLILVLAASLGAKGQSTPIHPAKPNADVLFIIDSVAMNTPQLKSVSQYIDPNSIKKINVEKNARYPEGAVYMTLKDSTLIHKILKDKFLTLNELALNNLPKQQRKLKPVYLLDDKLITDTTSILIPAMFVRQVQILKAQDAPYFAKTFPKSVIIKISTKDPQIYVRLRGNAE